MNLTQVLWQPLHEGIGAHNMLDLGEALGSGRFEHGVGELPDERLDQDREVAAPELVSEHDAEDGVHEALADGVVAVLHAVLDELGEERGHGLGELHVGVEQVDAELLELQLVGDGERDEVGHEGGVEVGVELVGGRAQDLVVALLELQLLDALEVDLEEAQAVLLDLRGGGVGEEEAERVVELGRLADVDGRDLGVGGDARDQLLEQVDLHADVVAAEDVAEGVLGRVAAAARLQQALLQRVELEGGEGGVVGVVVGLHGGREAGERVGGGVLEIGVGDHRRHLVGRPHRSWAGERTVGCWSG